MRCLELEICLLWHRTATCCFSYSSLLRFGVSFKWGQSSPRSCAPPPPPFSWYTGSLWTANMPCGFSSSLVVPADCASICACEYGKGASSRTPSERISIQRTRPDERGYRDSGRVMIAVSLVGYCRNNARRACRNWRIEFGCEDVGGYHAGERRDGMTRRWMVWLGVEAS